MPVKIDYESEHSRKARTGVVKQATYTGKALAHLTETTTPPARRRRAVETAERACPRRIQPRCRPSGDAADGSILTQGAKEGFTISDQSIASSGPDHLADATVAGFDLGGKLSARRRLATRRCAQEKEFTLFVTLAATLRVAPEGIRVDNLNLAPGARRAAAARSTSGNLDLKMLVKDRPTARSGRSTAGQRVPAFRAPRPARFVPDVGRAVKRWSRAS